MSQESAAGIYEISEIFHLVGIEPLLKPQLPLPAEEEDKLDHGGQAELPPLMTAAAAPAAAELSSLPLLPAYAGSLTPLPVPTWL